MRGLRQNTLPRLALAAVLFLVTAIGASGAPPAWPSAADPPHVAYLPMVFGPPPPAPAYSCPQTSSNPAYDGLATQWDEDCPVRPAALHADKNLALRGYTPNTDANLIRSLVNYGRDDPTRPPQFATLFSPARVPALVGFYRVYDWHWADSPDPGSRGAPLTTYKVTALGLGTTAGETLRVPESAYSIGGDPAMEVMVIFADEDSVALRYTREDSSASQGYTLHVDKICTDPNLLARYRALDQGNRYECEYQGWQGYNLPTLKSGQAFGWASGDEVVIAIVDTGNFMDPRSCNEWWQLRPGYTGSCPHFE